MELAKLGMCFTLPTVQPVLPHTKNADWSSTCHMHDAHLLLPHMLDARAVTAAPER